MTSVPEKQLRLFDAPKPLLERLGEQFFRSLPKSPGVYLMLAADGSILYVGQSGNLRQRLLSYKNATPENSSRKVIRLIHQTATIVWEVYADASAARLRENQLLRLHRPRFNVANTWPQAHYFVRLTSTEGTVVLSFTREDRSDDPDAFGAFKTATLPGYAALLRLGWLIWHGETEPDSLPRRIVVDRIPREFAFADGKLAPLERLEFSHKLSEFLAGESDRFSQWLKERFVIPEEPGFARSWWLNELALVEQFFLRGSGRNRALRVRNGVSSHTIPQSALDDLLALEIQGQTTPTQEAAT